MVETVGAGARKSVCFCDLLRWSVGRHGLLRSRCTHSRQRWITRQFVAAMGLDESSEMKYRPINYNNSAAFILAELNRRASD